jgi:hypothetical protein
MCSFPTILSLRRSDAYFRHHGWTARWTTAVFSARLTFSSEVDVAVTPFLNSRPADLFRASSDCRMARLQKVKLSVWKIAGKSGD